MIRVVSYGWINVGLSGLETTWFTLRIRGVEDRWMSCPANNE